MFFWGKQFFCFFSWYRKSILPMGIFVSCFQEEKWRLECPSYIFQLPEFWITNVHCLKSLSFRVICYAVDNYRWLFNNTGLNCMDPLKCRFLSVVNITVLRDSQLVESKDAEPWIWRDHKHGELTLSYTQSFNSVEVWCSQPLHCSGVNCNIWIIWNHVHVL